MATKFERILGASGDALLKRRASTVNETVKMEQEDIVNQHKRDYLRMQAELEQILDVSVRTRDSLSPTSESFDPKAMMRRVQQLKVDMRNKKIEWDIASATYSELFTDEAELTSQPSSTERAL